MEINPDFWLVLKGWGVMIILGLIVLWYYHGRHTVIFDIKGLLFGNGIVGFFLGLGTIAVGAPIVLIVTTINTIIVLWNRFKDFINQNKNRHGKNSKHGKKEG